MRDLKVLIVEDNNADIILTREFLFQVGIDKNILIAGDGEEAIDLISKRGKFEHSETPDLILLDINLPKIDGKEVLNFIKTNELYQSIPVIIYTSSEMESDRLYCYKNGANLYLNKFHNMSSDYLQAIERLKDFVDTHLKRKDN